MVMTCVYEMGATKLMAVTVTEYVPVTPQLKPILSVLLLNGPSVTGEAGEEDPVVVQVKVIGHETAGGLTVAVK